MAAGGGGGGTLVAAKAVDSDIGLVRAEDLAPGDISSFLLTAALYKAKAHGKAHPLAPVQPSQERQCQQTDGGGGVLKSEATHRAPAPRSVTSSD